MTNLQRLAAEALGSFLLLACVVGSGIMGVRLAAGNDALALLANSIATGGVLVALILVFGPLSGAHFNPAVSVFAVLRGEMGWRLALGYTLAQVLGACCGVAVAHCMFGMPLVELSQHARDSFGEFLGEVIATTGLLLVIWGTVRSSPGSVPFAVAGWIVGAYWFTSSTSFANPAVTVARALTDSFAGIAPASVPGFVLAQALAVLVATGIARFFEKAPR